MYPTGKLKEKIKEKKGFAQKNTGQKDVISSPTGSTDEDALTHIEKKIEKKERERDAAVPKHSKSAAGATLLALLVQKYLLYYYKSAVDGFGERVRAVPL